MTLVYVLIPDEAIPEALKIVQEAFRQAGLDWYLHTVTDEKQTISWFGKEGSEHCLATQQEFMARFRKAFADEDKS